MSEDACDKPSGYVSDDTDCDDSTYRGESDEDWAGSTVAAAGDVNRDGYDDLLIGAYGNDSGGSSAGAAYLLFGFLSGSVSLSDADVLFTGDVNSDGYDDLLIGASRGGDSGSSSREYGAAHLLFGASY